MTLERPEDTMEQREKKKKRKIPDEGEKKKKYKKKKLVENSEDKTFNSSSRKRKIDSGEDDSEAMKKQKKGILKIKKSQIENKKLISSATEEAMGEEEANPPMVNPSFQPSADSTSNSKKDKMRKKRELKRAAKSSAQEAKKNEAGEEIRRLEAQEYLRCWKFDKSLWKFSKNRQTWLLKNLFLPDALDDETFGILLEYLRPLKGKAREETIKQAEAKVNESGVDFLQAERARVVAQMLA